MKVICKIPEAVCPEGLHICCGTCAFRDHCKEACPAIPTEPTDCSDAQIMSDELMAFRAAVPEAIQQMIDICQMRKELEAKEKTAKAELLKAMEAHGIKVFETDTVKFTYVAPTTKTAIDGAKLKKEHPEIAEAYSKTSKVSAFVKVTVK